MKTLIANGTLITPTERVENGWLLADGERIAALGSGPAPAADRRIDAAGRFVAPCFVDLQAQGVDPDRHDERRCVVAGNTGGQIGIRTAVGNDRHR
jgi:dihydroorotase-like cyclic amidohydrolase